EMTSGSFDTEFVEGVTRTRTMLEMTLGSFGSEFVEGASCTGMTLELTSVSIGFEFVEDASCTGMIIGMTAGFLLEKISLNSSLIFLCVSFSTLIRRHFCHNALTAWAIPRVKIPTKIVTATATLLFS